MLDFLTFALCVPYSETTEGKHFDNLLEMVAKRGRLIFRLFQVSYYYIKKMEYVIFFLIQNFNFNFYC